MKSDSDDQGNIYRVWDRFIWDSHGASPGKGAQGRAHGGGALARGEETLVLPPVGLGCSVCRHTNPWLQ